jgi:NAD(P)-dependent dehydrogenase (short-subunit alcohol dehydrogenase family)
MIMNAQNNKNSRVWFITGTSGGIGSELVREVLRRGDSVVATSRNPQKVADTFGAHKDQLLAVAVDLGNSDQITRAVQAGISRFGKIDVLVNNAGYGLLGAVEEANDDEISRVHEINVFGLLRVLRAVLPHFRERKSGHVVNLSSISGLVGLPGIGIYNATKFAVEGISEALAAEVAPLGIKVTVVEPGPFRTEFLAGSLALAKNVIPEYEKTAGVTRAGAATRNGNQPGDPVRAAAAIIQAVTAENPPLHLLLGRMAYELANKKISNLQKDIEAWREVTLGADFEK